MDNKTIIKTSKFLSLVLRHKPEVIGIQLDEFGWVDVAVLLAALEKNGRFLTQSQLEEVVKNNHKKRFAFSEDGLRIRANQGHSLAIDLALAPQTPPDLLYHGTAVRFVDVILQEGLKKMNRQHVHLSATVETAVNVGSRHGKPHVLTISAKEMHQQGFKFYLSQNGVWLTDHVPPHFIASSG